MASQVEKKMTPGTIREKQQLVAAYMDHLSDLVPHYQKRRSLDQDINVYLLQDTTWNDVAAGGKVDQAITDQGKQTLDYLVSKVLPGEKRLHDKQKKLESAILGYKGEDRASQSALKDARKLAYVYNLHDQLQTVKRQNLSLHINMLADLFSDQTPVDIAGDIGLTESQYHSAQQRIAAYEKLLSDLQEENTPIANLKTNFGKVKTNFNKTVAQRAKLEMKRIDALVTEIIRQVDILKAGGGENQTYHADLLAEIVQQLNTKKEKLNHRLLELDDRYHNRGGNFLYVPKGLGHHPATTHLVSRYQQISQILTARTLSRKSDIERLYQALEATETDIKDEREIARSAFSELTTLPQSPFTEITTDLNATYSSVSDRLADLKQDLNGILSDFNAVENVTSEDITADINLSWTIIRLNQSIETVVNRMEVLMPVAMVLDVQLATIIRGASKYNPARYTPESNTKIERLIAVTESRNGSMSYAGEAVAHLKETFERDSQTTRDLRSLGADILRVFQSEYEDTLPDMVATLNDNLIERGQPYYNYLNDVYRLLENRAELYRTLVSKLPQDQDVRETDCVTCSEEQNLWHQTAHLDRAYIDAIEHIENLPAIRLFFTEDKFHPKTLFHEAFNLFQLSTLLKNPAFLKLNNDSIDITFAAGKGVVTMRGIGNPEKLDLVQTMMGNASDYFINPPYVGQGFNPAAAWNSITDTISDAASDIADTVSDAAVDIKDTVVDAAADVTDIVISTTTDGIQWAGDVLSDGWGHVQDGYQYVTQENVVGNWVYNTLNNAFVGDSGWETGLKIGGYIIAGAACAGAGWVAGLGCAPLAIMIAGDMAAGTLDTGAEFGAWSQEVAEWGKFAVGILEIIAGGVVNFKKASEIWGQMGKLKKFLTFLGLNPDDFAKAFKALVMGEGALDAIKALMKIPKWFNKIKSWSEQIGSIFNSDDQDAPNAQDEPDGLSSSDTNNPISGTDPTDPQDQDRTNSPGNNNPPVAQEGTDAADSDTRQVPAAQNPPKPIDVPPASEVPEGTLLPRANPAPAAQTPPVRQQASPGIEPPQRVSPPSRIGPPSSVEPPPRVEPPPSVEPPPRVEPPPAVSLPW